MQSSQCISQMLPLRPQMQTLQPTSFFKALWQRICDLASKIFTKLTNFYSAKEFFSSREVILLRDDRTSPHTPQAPILQDKNITVTSPLNASASYTTSDTKEPSEPPYHTYDDTLEDFRSFIREFSKMSADIIYEKHIVEHLESVQNLAPSLPPIIKSITKLLVEMGDKAAKPLFKRFAAQKAQAIDPALRKIFNILLKPDMAIFREKLSKHLLTTTLFKEDTCPSDYINPIINWLSTPEDHRKPLNELYEKNKHLDQQLIDHLCDKATTFWNEMQQHENEALYESLEKQLTTEFAESKIPLKENLEGHYIQPILVWLLRSDHSAPLTDIFGPLDLNKEELLDNIFERAITLLVEKKIDQYAQILEKTMERRLGHIIHQMVQKNASRIADFFSDRISELVISMPFTETIDNLIHNVLHLQIKGLIESEKDQEAQRQLLAKARCVAEITPANEESLEAQIRAQNHLNSAAKHGGDEAFLLHIKLENFSKHAACNPHIQQIIDQEINLILQNRDPLLSRRANEKALYTAIAENLVNLMTPTKKQVGANGEIEEIDPFVELWNRLYVPEEFYNLIKYSEELTQEFITPDTAALFEKIKQPTIEIIKNIFKTTTKDLLKKQLETVVEKTFEKLTHPQHLNEINAEHTFPLLNSLLIELFAKQELGRNLKEFAPYFHKLITADTEQRDMEIRNLQNALIKLSKNKFTYFDPTQFYSGEGEDKTKGMTVSELSPLDWLNLTQNVVIELEQEILNSQVNGQAFDPASTSPTEINAILKKIFKSSPNTNNPAFGELSMDILFKLGKLQNGSLAGFFIKDALSSNITESVEPWRESYHRLIRTTTQALKKSFLDQAALKALFSDNTPPLPSFTDQRLAHQIQVTACLAYDIIMGIAQEKGNISKYATKKLLTDNPDEINRMITTVYQKTLGNQILNQNLIVNACEKIFLSLAISSDSIGMRENIKAHQLAAEIVA